MRTEAVRAQLAAHGLGDRYREFTVSSATVALAAEALHCEAGRIAKTLSILTSTGPVLVVAMGLARLDNRKFKDLFHEKGPLHPRGGRGTPHRPSPGRGLPLCPAGRGARVPGREPQAL